MSPILTVKELDMKLPIPGGTLHAIQGLDFEVNPGETFCIVGESGSGKSLTALSLMGLLPRKAILKAKSLNFLDFDLMKLHSRDYANLRGNRLTMIFQEPMTSLNPCYTIGNQLTEVYKRHRKSKRVEARNRAKELLSKVGITASKAMNQYPHQLSGGLRQRVMIAMALMCEPDLIIADEPTTALDVTIQAQILNLMNSLKKEYGAAIIFITHDLGVVARIATRVAVMYAGQFVESSPINKLFDSPSHPYTQGLIGCIPVPGKTDKNALLKSIPGEVPDLSLQLEGCPFQNRCYQAKEVCYTKIPNIKISENHYCRCKFSIVSRKK
jgi:peptide/nickel transport system ATP-binding protein